MSHPARSAIALAVLGLSAMAAQAQYQLDVYAPPNNLAVLGMSSGGTAGVSYGSAGNMLLDSATGTFTPIGGNSAANGFSGMPGISGNGLMVAGNATAANGYSQAATYNVATGTWTTLGSLGFNATSVVYNGIRQQSAATAISSDGSTVVGLAYFNTTGTTGTRQHPVVFRDGLTIDLNPTGTTQTGRALAVSGNGNVVSGYASNSGIGTLWTWNGASYVASNPMIANPNTGTMINVQASALSDNGVWAAGGSVNGLATNYAPIGTFPTITFSPATLWNTETNTGILIPYDHVIDTTGGPDQILNMKTSVAGVSNNGTVIGTFDQCLSCATSITQQDTWIYSSETGVTMSFDAYLGSIGQGLTATQHVWGLYGMSADGSAISGVYFDSATGQSSTFVLRDISAVPEPGTWALFALGLPFAAWRRMRSKAAQA